MDCSTKALIDDGSDEYIQRLLRSMDDDWASIDPDYKEEKWGERERKRYAPSKGTTDSQRPAIDTPTIEADPEPSASKATEQNPEYSFHFAVDERTAGLDDSTLTAKLNQLVISATPYSSIRDQYCIICLEMNRRGTQAPAFREQRSLPRNNKTATDDDTLMMRDRQVIDLHWLFCRGKRDEPADRKFHGLFSGDELNFDLACELASKWKADVKAVKVLNLIEHEQMQLALLRSSNVRDRVRNAITSMNTNVDSKLRQRAVRNPQIRAHIEDNKRVWLAYSLAGSDGLGAVIQMHAWITGKKPVAKSTMSGKLKNLGI